VTPSGNAGFRIVGSSTVADVGFLQLTEEQVEAPDGEALTRYVVRHQGAVVIVPVDETGEGAYLVRQYRVATRGELLELPAGKRDVEGEAPAETARRELAEEIGRAPGRLVKLAEFYNSPGFCDEYTHLYCALDLEILDGPRGVNAEELAMTVERVAFADVDGLIAAGDLCDAKSIVGLDLARRYLAGTYPGMPASGSPA
jgi:8-oxo-dGTP pyrophosphatase MutT (NUDIX family)